MPERVHRAPSQRPRPLCLRCRYGSAPCHWAPAHTCAGRGAAAISHPTLSPTDTCTAAPLAASFHLSARCCPARSKAAKRPRRSEGPCRKAKGMVQSKEARPQVGVTNALPLRYAGTTPAHKRQFAPGRGHDCGAQVCVPLRVCVCVYTGSDLMLAGERMSDRDILMKLSGYLWPAGVWTHTQTHTHTHTYTLR